MARQRRALCKHHFFCLFTPFSIPSGISEEQRNNYWFFQHVVEFDDLSMRKETDKGYCVVEVVEAEYVDPHLDRAIHVQSRQ